MLIGCRFHVAADVDATARNPPIAATGGESRCHDQHYGLVKFSDYTRPQRELVIRILLAWIKI